MIINIFAVLLGVILAVVTIGLLIYALKADGPFEALLAVMSAIFVGIMAAVLIVGPITDPMWIDKYGRGVACKYIDDHPELRK